MGHQSPLVCLLVILLYPRGSPLYALCMEAECSFCVATWFSSLECCYDLVSLMCVRLSVFFVSHNRQYYLSITVKKFSFGKSVAGELHHSVRASTSHAILEALRYHVSQLAYKSHTGLSIHPTYSTVSSTTTYQTSPFL